MKPVNWSAIQLAQELAKEAVIQDERETYAALILKIDAFQCGKGPAPTPEDFDAWKRSIDQRLSAGINQNTVKTT